MVRRIIIDAGDITLKYFEPNTDLIFDTKGDGSPVTIADRETENFIASELQNLLPGIPVVGEEAVSSGTLPNLKNTEYFWLVDPIDATKEFTKGGDEYTVNIALIHN